MLAVALLINEHAVILRGAVLVGRVLPLLESGMICPPEFLYDVVDFAQTFIGECHWGKEEGLFYAELEGKRLPAEMVRALQAARRDHEAGRAVVAQASETARALTGGDPSAAQAVVHGLRAIMEILPRHCAHEERQVFLPAIHYFSDAEQRLLLRNFEEFDRQLVDEKYRRTLGFWEARFSDTAAAPPG